MTGRAARLRAAGAALDRDQRYAALAAAGLLLTMFLPWYEKSAVIAGTQRFAKDSISAFGAVSFVEAAIFLVSAGVLVLVLTRAEGGRYHLPGGDGTVIFAAGLWASALIFYRVFDRPNVSGTAGTVGIQWGFFVAFVAAGALAVAGQRMRAAARPAPVRLPRPDRYRPPEPASDFDDVDANADADADVDVERDGAGATAVVPHSESHTEVVPSSERRTEVAPHSDARTEVVPHSDARTEVVPGSARRTEVAPHSDSHTEVVPRSERRTQVAPDDTPRDRRVTRADAEELTFEGPEIVEPPPAGRRGPRSRRARDE